MTLITLLPPPTRGYPLSMERREEEIEESKALDILLVEEDPLDVLVTRKYLSLVDVPYRLYRVRDGIQAIDFLRKSGDFQKATRPHLIVINVDIPNLNGYQLLDILRNDIRLRNIPVVIKTRKDENGKRHSHFQRHLTNPVWMSPYDFTSVIAAMSQLAVESTGGDFPAP